MTGNKKSFSLITVSSKTFRMILNNFDFAVTFLFRINNKIKITFISSLINKFVQTVNLKKIKILISQVKLITRIAQNLNLKRIRISINPKLIGKIISLINIRMPIAFISKARQKITSSIIMKKVNFSFSAILATFFTLGYYDPSDLATMDIKTLSELDYIES